MQRTLDELWPSWARGSDVCTVVTLYDLIPLVFPDHYLRDPVIRTRYETRAELVRRADRVLAISQTTADDAVEHLGIEPDRISVIDAGATEKFADMYSSPQAAWDVLAVRLRSVRPGYVLYVAGFEFRKNLERVIAAYGLLAPELRASHQLVIACRMLPSEAELLGSLGSRCRYRGGAAGDHRLRDRRRARRALPRLRAVPVRFDLRGIGACRSSRRCPVELPVVASNTSTAPEILGDLEPPSTHTSRPRSPSAWQTVIESPPTIAALTERSRRRVGAYTWDAVAERSLLAYEQVVRERRATGAPPATRA